MGNVKDECYANQPETIQELKHEIKVVIDEIRAHTVENILRKIGLIEWGIVQSAVHLKLYFMAMYVLSFQ